MIYLGDLFDVLPKLAAESIDSCVTDPPYGIGVMGKEWDTFKPDNRSTNHQPIDHKKQSARSASMHAGSYSKTLAAQRAFQAWTERWAREVFRVLKPGGYILVCGAPRSFHRMTSGLEDAGFDVRDCFSWLYGQGFPKSLNLSKAFDQALGVEREVVGRAKGASSSNTEAQGVYESEYDVTKPPTDLAKKWNGWGTALKPSWEPIVLARKPLVDTLVVNVAMYGTGALNIDACRIQAEDGDRFGGGGLNSPDRGFMAGTANTYQKGMGFRDDTEKGRWPPNVLLDEESAAMLDASTDRTSSGQPRQDRGTGGIWTKGDGIPCGHQYGDSGGVSRFFYVAKPSGAERDEGCYDLPSRTPMDLTGRKEDSAGLKHARAGTDRTATNHHPTVKPVTLMQWLVTLVTPPGGTVLDPFMGSGTTGMAARLADLQFVGVEREAEYVEIARRRISETNALFSGEEEVK